MTSNKHAAVGNTNCLSTHIIGFFTNFPKINIDLSELS